MAKAYSIEPQTIIMTIESKSLFASKTFWLNVLMPVFMLLSMRGISVSPEDQVYIVTAVMALSNVVMRFVTEQGVYLVSPPARRWSRSDYGR